MVAYHRPHSLAEALDIRAAADVMVLAGGTDVYPARTGRLAWGDPGHKPVLDITAVPGLRAIEETAETYRFGCLVTWTDIARADLPPLFDGYRRAACEVGGVQVQNRGTLVGNVCTASPAGDGIPNLMALDAAVELTSRGGTRRVPIASFFTGYRATVCRPDEIVTALIVPKLPGARGHFRKLGARKYLVISIAMVSGVVVADAAGRIATVRIAVGACSAVAQRLTALEAALVGAPLGEASRLVDARHLAALAPIDDIRATAPFRLSAALTLTRDLIADLAADRTRRAA